MYVLRERDRDRKSTDKTSGKEVWLDCTLML